MSEPEFPPPAYQEIETTSTDQQSNPNGQVWYRKFIEIEFNHDEAIKYSKLFIDNDIELNMISELNDDVLKGIGIEKAGHRIRILRLQTKTTSVQRSQHQEIHRCTLHPHMIVNEKCYKCNRFICLYCRRKNSIIIMNDIIVQIVM